MNKVILMGRLTRDPEIRYTSGENQTAVARYTLAVIVDLNVRVMSRQQTLSTVSFSAEEQSLQKAIFIRAQRL